MNEGLQQFITEYGSKPLSDNRNKELYKIIDKGILEGFTLSESSGDVVISTGILFHEDSTEKQIMRFETTTDYTLTSVTSSTPYIVGVYVWEEVEENYLDFQAKAFADIDTDDIIIGKAIFTGSTLSGFDYGETNYCAFVNLYDKQGIGKVTPLSPYSNKVYVEAIPNILIGKRPVSFAGGESPTFDTTPSERIDLLLIDGAGELSILKGTDSATPSTPDYPLNYYVLAEIHLYSSTTEITGVDISQRFPYVYTYKEELPHQFINSATQFDRDAFNTYVGSLRDLVNSDAQIGNKIPSLLNDSNSSKYAGGVYSPTQDRIYLVPYAAGR
jgi:hypothetical protein